ncbi:MAG: beta-L-arabinofuranosidase domain-containing protein, partial [Planctomycetota bacterium]
MNSRIASLPILATLIAFLTPNQLFAQEEVAQSSFWSDPEVKRFTDDFEAAIDFLEADLTSTQWDGIIGKGENETAEVIEAEDGKLTLKSTRGRYQEPWKPLGPMLYKTVQGDFRATVQIVDYQDTSYNNGGIMARVADPRQSGKGEDWISIDYFPIYGGIYARMADDNHRSEPSNNGQGRSADKFLQLERQGNIFFLRHSPDGKTWTDLDEPFSRTDLAGIPLQVGLFQATYSGNSGAVSFDNFVLEELPPSPIARLVYPKNGQKDLPRNFDLKWIPGFESGAQYVYLGTDREAVERSSSDNPETLQGCTASGPRFPIDYLDDGKQYFWRVDAVDDKKPPGEIWTFSTYQRQLENFEGYVDANALQEVWSANDGNAQLAQLGIKRSDEKENRFLILSSNAVSKAADARKVFSSPQNWYDSAYNFRSLRVRLKSQDASGIDSFAMALTDADWETNTAKVEFTGLDQLSADGWTIWNIDLRDFTQDNPAFRLSQVDSIGFQLDGTGSLQIDNLSIEYPSKNDGPLVQEESFVNAVPFENVRVTGGLWRERMDVNRQVSLPHVWGRCEDSTKGNGEPSKRLDNFKKAGGLMEGPFTGTYFNDSDVYKIIEGTANSLLNHPDADLEAYTDQVIDWIAAAQWEDGYLFTFYSLPKKQPERRWTNIGSMHELYCAGHLIEAAIAYRNATGKDKLFRVATRFADLICETFGRGKLETAPGHQEIELALVKLYEATKNPRYLETAKFFVDQRGNSGRGDERRRLYGTYSQDHMPLVEQEEGVGHSVRAGYLFCAATDLARMNKDDAYANAMFRLWDNIVNKKLYLTGGIGQPGGPEGFAGNYQLGNGCYAETCSGIAFVMWNHRLHLMTGEAKYADLIERTLYNNMLSALSQEGRTHYYTNPLTTNGRQRWEWPGHDCACCPSNLVRLISSIGEYMYSTSEDTIRVNQFIDSTSTVRLGENQIELTQKTNYPWEGKIQIEVKPQVEAEFEIKLRLPGWAHNQPLPSNLYRNREQQEGWGNLFVNGQPVDSEAEQGYITIRQQWKPGDKVMLNLNMPVRQIVAHPKVKADRGLVAIQR